MSHFSKDDGQNVKIEVEFRILNSQYQRNVAHAPSIFLLLLASWKALVKHCNVKASADLFNTLPSKILFVSYSYFSKRIQDTPYICKISKLEVFVLLSLN